MKWQRKKGPPPAHSADPGSRPAVPKDSGNHWMIFLICILLAVITFGVFGQTMRYGFVNYDDDVYVYDNATVTAGLTLQGIISAFSHCQLSNWIPLTMISHMLDCQFYQLNAGGHHLTNVLLHTASAIILFLILRRMTGALWRSAVTAAVFAVHPLHVESVAWVAERKDVLSGLFFMLTLWAYADYVRKPGSPAKYLRVIFWFALGLMSKPMLVTVPIILLLLDDWPLNRFSTSTPKQLILEKVPLLGLSIACGIITIFAQGHAIQPLTEYPLTVRVENALVSCVIYACQLFHPANLAVIYPYPSGGYPLFEVFGATFLVAVISLGVFLWRQQYPYLLVGWLWYLIMLLPVIGLVQVGSQSRADRYTYLPEIGLGLLVVWRVAELSARLRHGRVVLGTGAGLVLASFMVSAHIQTTFWSDGESLWTHALACTQDNSIAHNNLGFVLAQKGDMKDAIRQFESAVDIDPNYGEAFNNLGNVFAIQGQLDQALADYLKAHEIEPDSAKIENNLGLVYVHKGQIDEAINHFQSALAIDPGNPDASNDLHQALDQKKHEAGAGPPP